MAFIVCVGTWFCEVVRETEFDKMSELMIVSSFISKLCVTNSGKL